MAACGAVPQRRRCDRFRVNRLQLQSVDAPGDTLTAAACTAPAKLAHPVVKTGCNGLTQMQGLQFQRWPAPSGWVRHCVIMEARGLAAGHGARAQGLDFAPAPPTPGTKRWGPKPGSSSALPPVLWYRLIYYAWGANLSLIFDARWCYGDCNLLVTFLSHPYFCCSNNLCKQSVCLPQHSAQTSPIAVTTSVCQNARMWLGMTVAAQSIPTSGRSGQGALLGRDWLRPGVVPCICSPASCHACPWRDSSMEERSPSVV